MKAIGKDNIASPQLIIDKSLNKNSDKIFFPNKVEKMTQLLKNVPPPKLK